MSGKTEDQLPWERKPGETSKMFELFCLFRDYPYKNKDNVTSAQIKRHRKLKTIAEEQKVNYNRIRDMSAAYHWVERAAQYDDYIDEKNRQEQEAEIIKMRKLHAEVARAMVKKAAEKILSLDIEDITVREAIKMFEVGVHAERLSRGETTENLAAEVNDKSGMVGMQGLIKSLQAARAKQGE